MCLSLYHQSVFLPLSPSPVVCFLFLSLAFFLLILCPSFFFFFFKNLFIIWLHQILVAACGIFMVMQDPSLRRADFLVVACVHQSSVPLFLSDPQSLSL